MWIRHTLSRVVLIGSHLPSPIASNPFFSKMTDTRVNRISFMSTISKPVEDQDTGKRPQSNRLLMEEIETHNKPRILCLHGFRTSASVLQKQISKWPQTVLEKLDLVFLDGPFPAQGKSDVEGFFDPPFFEWYQCSQDYKEYKNFEECMAYIEEYMINHGPFDGLLGFSQGAMISAAVPGMQLQGVALTRVPKIKFLMIISGSKFIGYKFGQPKLAANAFASPINCPSLHFIGEKDFLKPAGIALLESFVDPVVIDHPKGHTIPTLDEKGAETMLGFIETIQKTPVSPENLDLIGRQLL